MPTLKRCFSRVALAGKAAIIALTMAVVLGCDDNSSSKARIIEDNPVKNDSAVVPGYSLFWGNSLLLGYQQFGMSASAVNKDYYWQVENYFKTHDIPFDGHRVTGIFENMASLEEQEAFLEERIYPHLSDSTGLVVIQLGDNVDTDEELAIMEESVSHVMETVRAKAPNAHVFWVGEWYSSKFKQELLIRTAEENGVNFVDISDLNTPENQARVGQVIVYPEEREFQMAYDSIEVKDSLLTVNFTWSDTSYTSTVKVSSYKDVPEQKQITWVGVEYIVPDSFVASHPNDKAFAEIYKRIMAALGYTL